MVVTKIKKESTNEWVLTHKDGKFLSILGGLKRI